MSEKTDSSLRANMQPSGNASIVPELPPFEAAKNDCLEDSCQEGLTSFSARESRLSSLYHNFESAYERVDLFLSESLDVLRNNHPRVVAELKAFDFSDVTKIPDTVVHEIKQIDEDNNVLNEDLTRARSELENFKEEHSLNRKPVQRQRWFMITVLVSVIIVEIGVNTVLISSSLAQPPIEAFIISSGLIGVLNVLAMLTGYCGFRNLFHSKNRYYFLGLFSSFVGIGILLLCSYASVHLRTTLITSENIGFRQLAINTLESMRTIIPGQDDSFLVIIISTLFIAVGGLYVGYREISDVVPGFSKKQKTCDDLSGEIQANLAKKEELLNRQRNIYKKEITERINWAWGKFQEYNSSKMHIRACTDGFVSECRRIRSWLDEYISSYNRLGSIEYHDSDGPKEDLGDILMGPESNKAKHVEEVKKIQGKTAALEGILFSSKKDIDTMLQEVHGLVAKIESKGNWLIKTSDRSSKARG